MEVVGGNGEQLKRQTPCLIWCLRMFGAEYCAAPALVHDAEMTSLRRGSLSRTAMPPPNDIHIGDIEAGEGEPLYEDVPSVPAYASAISPVLSSSCCPFPDVNSVLCAQAYAFNLLHDSR